MRRRLEAALAEVEPDGSRFESNGWLAIVRWDGMVSGRQFAVELEGVNRLTLHLGTECRGPGTALLDLRRRMIRFGHDPDQLDLPEGIVVISRDDETQTVVGGLFAENGLEPVWELLTGRDGANSVSLSPDTVGVTYRAHTRRASRRGRPAKSLERLGAAAREIEAGKDR